MPDSAGPGGATPLEGLLDAARNTHAEAVVTALRQLRDTNLNIRVKGATAGGAGFHKTRMLVLW